MRKFLLAGLVAAMSFAPIAGMAHSDGNEDAKTCRAGSAEPLVVGAADDQSADNVDRASLCVHAEGTTVLYIGGEAQSEDNPGTGGACGAIIIADENVTGSDEDWNSGNGHSHCQ